MWLWGDGCRILRQIGQLLLWSFLHIVLENFLLVVIDFILLADYLILLLDLAFDLHLILLHEFNLPLELLTVLPVLLRFKVVLGR